jgi:hypothetical protein
MTSTWTEVASQEVLDVLLEKYRRSPRPKPLGVRVIELPLGPVPLEVAVTLAEALGGCPKRQNALTAIQNYTMIGNYGYCRCTNLADAKITITRFPLRERIEVEVPEPPCAHPGNWNEVTEQQYVRALTVVREASERHWGHDRYPDRQVWRAEFHCGGHP